MSSKFISIDFISANMWQQVAAVTIAITLFFAQYSQAANSTWSGGANSVNLSSNGNWDTLPVTASNSWTFGSANGTQGTILNNDFSGFTVKGITFNADALPWTINGNAITLSSGITNNSTTNQNLDLNITFSSVSTIAVNGTGSLAMYLQPGGWALTKAGAGTLIFSGLTVGGGSGDLYLNQGQITFKVNMSTGRKLHISNGTALDNTSTDLVSWTTSNGMTISIDGSFTYLGTGGDLTLNPANSSGDGFNIASNSTINVVARTLTLGGNARPMVGAGGITKEGEGTLTILSPSINSGPITVNSGRLNLSGSASNAAMFVASGATLGGEGSVPSLILSNANLRVDVSTITNAFTATNGMTLSGINTVYLDVMPVAATNATIRLLNYGGTLTGGVGNLVLANAANYRTNGFSINASQINLDFSSKALTWSGSTDVWDIGGATNWSSVVDKYYDGDIVTFTAVGTKTVTLNNTVRPGSNVVFNTTAGNDYTLSGSGGIAGPCGLTVGSATKVSAVTLNTMNSYTGATLVVGSVSNASLLTIAGTGALTGGSPLTIGSGQMRGIMQYNSSEASTFSAITVGYGTSSNNFLNQTTGTIKGSSLSLGLDTAAGCGAVQISGGAMTISGLTAFKSSTATNNFPTNSIIVSGAGVFNANGGLLLSEYAAANKTCNGKFIQNGGTVTVAGTSGLQLANAGASNTIAPRLAEYDLNGGTLNVNMIANSSTSAFDAIGTFVFNGGTLKPTTGSAAFWVNSAYTTASITNGGAIIDTEGYNITIAQPLLHAAGATNVTLTKAGSGTLTLSGSNTWSGATVISNGVLAVAATGNLGNSSNTLNIVTGGRLEPASTNVVVRYLYFDGVMQKRGTWGSPSSTPAAANINGTYFQGTGSITVTEQGPIRGTVILVR